MRSIFIYLHTHNPARYIEPLNVLYKADRAADVRLSRNRKSFSRLEITYGRESLARVQTGRCIIAEITLFPVPRFGSDRCALPLPRTRSLVYMYVSFVPHLDVGYVLERSSLRMSSELKRVGIEYLIGKICVRMRKLFWNKFLIIFSCFCFR